MAVRVGINGFGRIGRNFYRAVRASGADVDLVAVNDLTSPEINAHLLKYDTTHGTLKEEVKVTGDGIAVGPDSFKVLSERDPKALPWGEFGVGVNDHVFDPDAHKIVSNASCTTNCFVPMVKVLDDAFGVQKGLMTTVHAYTNDQNLLDLVHKDLRRGRAAAVNIVPSSTGAARATSLVVESMKGRLDGTALRVPVADGSITDFVAILEKEVTVEEV